MKIINIHHVFAILLPLGFCNPLYSQPFVNIPDVNFYNALLSHGGLDKNEPFGLIDSLEAANYAGVIDVSGKGITDMIGIESFTSIGGLECEYNKIDSLDLSMNSKLGSVTCNNNLLVWLKTPENISKIDCNNNKINLLKLNK